MLGDGCGGKTCNMLTVESCALWLEGCIMVRVNIIFDDPNAIWRPIQEEALRHIKLLLGKMIHPNFGCINHYQTLKTIR